MFYIIITGLCLATAVIPAQVQRNTVGLLFPPSKNITETKLSSWRSWSAPKSPRGWAAPQTTSNTCEASSVPVGSCPTPDTQFPTYLPSSTDCTCFFVCSNGIPYQFQCAPHTFYDYYDVACEYHYEAECWFVNNN